MKFSCTESSFVTTVKFRHKKSAYLTLGGKHFELV